MPFREKSAWISLVTTLAVYAYYFWRVMDARAQGQAECAELFGLLVGCIVILIVWQVILHIIAAIWSPRDALARQDEREKLITLKATHIAFYVVVTGVLIAACGLMIGADGFIMANLLLFALVVGEIAKYASQIVYFRKGI